MIVKYFIELIIFLLGSFFSMLSSIMPDFDFMSTLSTAINSLLGVSTQAINFLYFIFGDTLYVIFTILGGFLPLRYIAVPLLSFIRKFIAWGGGG